MLMSLVLFCIAMYVVCTIPPDASFEVVVRRLILVCALIVLAVNSYTITTVQ